jgi:hypothetical protein
VVEGEVMNLVNELAAIVEKLAAFDPIRQYESFEMDFYCVFCEGDPVPWDKKEKFKHKTQCLWFRSHQWLEKSKRFYQDRVNLGCDFCAWGVAGPSKEAYRLAADHEEQNPGHLVKE